MHCIDIGHKIAYNIHKLKMKGVLVMAVKADTSMTIRMNKEVKQEAQQIFSSLGMDMTTAINVFLRQAIYHNGFPFDVRLETPNAVTLSAMEEGDKMIHDPNAKRFSSVEELFAELDEE